MTKTNHNYIVALVLVSISIFTLFVGYFFNEDPSTGGSQWDFNVTWPLVVDYSNFNFFDAQLKYGAKPRHLPLHYIILAGVYKILNDQNFVRLFYLFFSLLMPTFLSLKVTALVNVPPIIVDIASEPSSVPSVTSRT